MRLFGSHAAKYLGWPTVKLNDFVIQTAKGMQCSNERSADIGDSVAEKTLKKDSDNEEIVAIDEGLKLTNLYAFYGSCCVGYTINPTLLLASSSLENIIQLPVRDFRRIPMLDSREVCEMKMIDRILEMVHFHSPTKL